MDKQATTNEHIRATDSKQVNPPRSKCIVVTHIYTFLFSSATIYAGVQSMLHEHKYYEMTALFLLSVVSLSLVVSTIVLFFTVN